jgi:hypothetical protein
MSGKLPELTCWVNSLVKFWPAEITSTGVSGCCWLNVWIWFQP